jgi:hypothetical protein
MKLNGLIVALTISALFVARAQAGTSVPSTQPIKFDYLGSWVREYRGEIGDNLPIGLTLRIAKDGETGTGCYFYYKYCKDIRIAADIKGRSILIREYDAKGKQTGQFAGQFPTNDPRHHFYQSGDLQGEVIAGDWSKPDGSEQKSFYLFEESMQYWPEGRCRYWMAGFDDEAAVDRFMTRFRQAVLDGDAHKVAGMIAFPIGIDVNGKLITFANSIHFLRQYVTIFTASFVEQFRLALPCHLFSKDVGVMLGNGEAWVSSIGEQGKFVTAVTQINNDIVTQSLTEDKAIHFLENAPSFIAFAKRAHGHWSCKTDSSAENETEISVGHDHPDHFEVDETFKVLSDGTVYVMRGDTDDGWKLDYQPRN